VAPGGACADGAANAGSCNAACTSALSAYVAACQAQPIDTYSVASILEPGRALSANNTCRAAFLTAAQAALPATQGASAQRAVVGPWRGGGEGAVPAVALRGRKGRRACARETEAT
jgi:hypothetical protein